jgi:hypothetical protein
LNFGASKCNGLVKKSWALLDSAVGTRVRSHP